MNGDVIISFIDRPVRAMLEYFTNTAGNFLGIALRLARIMALLGILWSAVQVAFGTMETRKFFVGTLTKFFAFLAIMSLYPAFSHGLQKFAVAVGTSGSGMAVSTLTQQLADYMGELQKVVNSENEDLENAIRKAQAVQEAYEESQRKYNEMGWRDKWKYFWSSDYVSSYQVELSQNELAWTEAQIEASRKNKLGATHKVLAIQSVLTTSYGDDLTPHYSLDIDMKDANGKSTGYLSVDAIARISLLAGEIMKDNEWVNDVMVNAFSSEDKWEKMSDEERQDFQDKVRTGKKHLTIMNFPVGAFMRYLLVCAAVMFLMITTVGCLIQYIMCIVEYSICTSYSILLVPCMLFDGLKDMASKVLPMLLSQGMKLSVITFCMFFNAYTYMRIAMDTVAASSAFELRDFFYVVFTGFLTFTLSINAPKLASAIMTGQPQMSMGEFMQAGAAVAAGAVAANKAREFSQRTAAGALRHGMNGLGTASAAVGAFQGTRAGGGSVGEALGASMKEVGDRAGESLKRGAMNFIHTGKISGGKQGSVYNPSAGGGNSLPPAGSGTAAAAPSSADGGGGTGGAAAGGGGGGQQGGAPEGASQEPSAAVAQAGAGDGFGGTQPAAGGDRIVGADANMNPVSARFANSVAQRFDDAMANNGASYTGRMGAGTYVKTQRNTAFVKAMQRQMSRPPQPRKASRGNAGSNVSYRGISENPTKRLEGGHGPNLIAPDKPRPNLPAPAGNKPPELPPPAA